MFWRAVAYLGLPLPRLQEADGQRFLGKRRFADAQVSVRGRSRQFSRATDTGRTNTYKFCPACGAIVVYQVELRPGFLSVPIGAFADSSFPPPTFELFPERRLSWCAVALETP